MKTGRPKKELTVSEAVREILGRWTRRATTAQHLALHARIVFACANSKRPSRTICKPTTKIQDRSFGLQAPTRSSEKSPDFAKAFVVQDTSYHFPISDIGYNSTRSCGATLNQRKVSV